MTIDSARRILPLAMSDYSSYTTPLLGVWIKAGRSDGGGGGSESALLRHPVVRAAVLWYRSAPAITRRSDGLLSPPDAVLLAAFPADSCVAAAAAGVVPCYEVSVTDSAVCVIPGVPISHRKEHAWLDISVDLTVHFVCLSHRERDGEEEEPRLRRTRIVEARASAGSVSIVREDAVVWSLEPVARQYYNNSNNARGTTAIARHTLADIQCEKSSAAVDAHRNNGDGTSLQRIIDMTCSHQREIVDLETVGADSASAQLGRVFTSAAPLYSASVHVSAPGDTKQQPSTTGASSVHAAAQRVMDGLNRMNRLLSTTTTTAATLGVQSTAVGRSGSTSSHNLASAINVERAPAAPAAAVSANATVESGNVSATAGRGDTTMDIAAAIFPAASTPVFVFRREPTVAARLPPSSSSLSSSSSLAEARAAENAVMGVAKLALLPKDAGAREQPNDADALLFYDALECSDLDYEDNILRLPDEVPSSVQAKRRTYRNALVSDIEEASRLLVQTHEFVVPSIGEP